MFILRTDPFHCSFSVSIFQLFPFRSVLFRLPFVMFPFSLFRIVRFQFCFSFSVFCFPFSELSFFKNVPFGICPMLGCSFQNRPFSDSFCSGLSLSDCSFFTFSRFSFVRIFFSRSILFRSVVCQFVPFRIRLVCLFFLL